jgi:acyl-CoA synthetase (AMP-forming)/AMP-acid ligase II
MHTPYGATEALPVSSISATEVLAQTAAKTRQGAGTCVGRPFPAIRLKIIQIAADAIESLAGARELPPGEIGEIIVQGEVVTREYFRRPEATAAAKIRDGERFWHRMGDVGYVDEAGCLWFCGRKSQIVETTDGPMFTDCVEPIFNDHPRVARCALVGIGSKPRQTPVIVVELEMEGAIGRLPDSDRAATKAARRRACIQAAVGVVIAELRELAKGNANTRTIERFLLYPDSLPVDVRHNTKINREQLAEWASRQ